MTGGTLADDLRAAAAARPGHPAVVDAHRRVTYAELAREAGGLAAGLVGMGVRRGDRVALVLRNSVESAVALYGAVLAGAAVVPLDATSPEERLVHLLRHSGAAVVICDPATAARVRPAARVAGRTQVVVTDQAGPGDVALTELTALLPHPGVPLLDVDLAAIIYTSGSTGVPKGATFLHRNVHFVTSSVLDYLGLVEDDRILSVLPLSHTYGLYQLLMAVRLGATVVLQHGTALPGRLVQAIDEHAITVLPGVPTLWAVLVSLHGLAERSLPTLRVLTNAGAALPPSRLAEVLRTFPRAQLFSMYGQTECKRVCYLPPEQLERRPDSVGIPIPGTEVWVEREDGSEAAPGEVGELVVRGDHVMQGYWGDPEGTARKLVPGQHPGDRVLRTGDLFRRDDEGFLYFVARRDDIITTRGEKVAPLEVERVLCTAPGVRDAAVVGVPDDLLGQRVVAHVSALPGHELQPAALRRHCAQHLEDAKVPAQVVLHEELPRLGNGKIDRLALAGGLALR
ncbi:MAG: AMP-binding protein [Mycobacteriales bacterium]